MKKRLGALLCALVMCLALLSPASALEEVCFTSLNNKLLPLASDTMPLWSGGVLYVPASLFDGSATNASYGVTLGVSLTQSQSSGTITLYSLSGILVFDLNSGICVDQQTGELLSGRAITRNGRIYLPLNIVVDFFGLRAPISTPITAIWSASRTGTTPPPTGGAPSSPTMSSSTRPATR